MSQAEFTDNTDDIVGYSAPEYFCEGLARIEQVGPCRRLVFVIHERSGGRRERIAVVKLVLSADVLIDITQMIAADLKTPVALASFSPTALAN